MYFPILLPCLLVLCLVLAYSEAEKVNSCDDPGNVSHARRNGSMFTVASSVTYVCDTGYVLEGSPQLFCKGNGKWNVDLPSCKKIECEPPVDPQNGRVIYNSLNYTAKLQYECNEAFLLVLTGDRICSIDGHWSGEEPECIEIPCEHPEAPLNGRVDLSSTKATIGSIATYSCDKGYKLRGSNITECLIGGWTYPPPVCSNNCYISELEYKEGVDTSRTEYAVSNSYADTYCLDGYLSSFSSPLCLNGTWQYSDQESPCRPAPCFLYKVEHGVIQYKKSQKKHKPRLFEFKYDEEAMYGNRTGGIIGLQGHQHFIRCHDSYAFQGKTGLKRFRVQCDRGRWIPEPICLRLGQPMPSEVPKNKSSRNSLQTVTQVANLPSTTEIPPFEREAVTKHRNSKETRVVTAAPHAGVTDSLDSLKTNCTCLFNPPNPDVKAFSRNGFLQFGSRVKNGSRVLFRCNRTGFRRLTGSRVIRCENCMWNSKQFPTCEKDDDSVSCTLESLMHVLPNKVVPATEDVKGPDVTQGDILKLECSQDDLRLLGVPNATCSESGTWIVDKVSCFRGCGPILKSEESKLIVEPEKDSYRFGEHVIMYCPPGYTLSSEVEILVCLSHGWSDQNIPSCLST